MFRDVDKAHKEEEYVQYTLYGHETCMTWNEEKSDKSIKLFRFPDVGESLLSDYYIQL